MDLETPIDLHKDYEKILKQIAGGEFQKLKNEVENLKKEIELLKKPKIGTKKDSLNKIFGFLDDAFESEDDFKKWAESDE